MAGVKSPALLAAAALLFFASSARAQSDEPPTEPLPAPTQPAPTQPEQLPVPAPPRVEPVAPEPPQVAPPRQAPPEITPEEPPHRSEGRMLVSLYNAGFQWGISPGVVVSDDKVSFAISLGFGYGFDLDTVILVPGVRLAAYFTDPNVYVGMPTVKLVLPLDRFAPFIEGGAGYGHLDGADGVASKGGAALMGGGGFMIHFRPVAFGAEASYQAITGTSFKGWSIGPILALGF